MNDFFLCCAVLAFAVGCTQMGGKPTNKPVALQPATHCAPKTADKDWYASDTKAPLLGGLDGIDFKITTRNVETQAYFNQGLMLSYGFNHAEAARSFFEASRHDTTCAMAYWGYAYVLGPNYNAGMEEGHYERAYAAVQKARLHAAGCSEKERLLIEALALRYTETPPEDRGPLDVAFSAAMNTVYQRYPDDAEISALYAESLMNLHPWDLYDNRTKEPKPWTPEIVALLERSLQRHPRHPAAHHLYIHAVEASNQPERGLESARILEALVPGSGHLLHMPSHIYIRTGHYHLGSLANVAAIAADSAYFTACHAQGTYPLAYYPHNHHFLAATATLQGNSKLAWAAAKKVQENTAQELMALPGWGTLQHYYTIPYYVAIKFGRWDDILSIPPRTDSLVYPAAVLHYARGMAYLGKDHVAKAEHELGLLKTLAQHPQLHAVTVWDINSAYDIVQIAVHVLSAEIHHKQQRYAQAIPLFYAAISAEDELNYNEPPDWFFSVRHQLGQTLLEAGRYAEAERIYREDLKNHPENGWALIGLHAALQQQRRTDEAAFAKKRFDKAWQHADVVISSSSCLFRL